MKIAITGVSGFVGAVVAREAAARGLEVLPVGRANARYDDLESLKRVLVGAYAVIHLAGPAHSKVGDADRQRYFRDIRDATVNLWRAAERVGCRRFVYASTIKVYGEALPEAVHETTACHPQSVYGEAKLAAEAALIEASLSGRMQLTILRFPPMYGPGMRGAVRHLFRAAALRLPLPVHGFLHRRSLVYVDNAARVLLGAAAGELPQQLYVVHDPEAWTIGALYAAIFQAVNGRPLPFWLRWRVPALVATLLGRSKALAPLTAPFLLASHHYSDVARHLRGSSPEWLTASAQVPRRD